MANFKINFGQTVYDFEMDDDRFQRLLSKKFAELYGDGSKAVEDAFYSFLGDHTQEEYDKIVEDWTDYMYDDLKVLARLERAEYKDN